VAPIVTVEEVKEFELLLNAGAFKLQLQQAGFHVILHGHKHWNETFLDTAVSEGGAHVVVSGGTVAGAVPSDKLPGFYWIEYDKKQAIIRTRYVMLGKSGQDPETSFRGPSIEFDIPMPRQPVGITQSLNANSKGSPVDLHQIYRNTEESLLNYLHKQPIRPDLIGTGWAHRLDDARVSMIATAYGLLIMHLVESSHPKFLKEKTNIINSLLAMRLKDGGWSSSSQGNIGRPEATAWAIAALHKWGFDSEMKSGLKALEKMFTNGHDPIAKKYVFTVSLVLRIVSEIDPASKLLNELAEILRASAALDKNGQIKYWSKNTFHNLDAVRSLAATEPSVLHTAHAVIGLIHAWRASNGTCGLPPDKLYAAQQWLLEQTAWDNTYEHIYRETEGVKYEPLTVNHYTNPWVIIALLESGISSKDNKIMDAVGEIVELSENGLWNWGYIKRPIWATYDAIRALTEYAHRTYLP